MDKRLILLVEDNLGDEALTLHPLKKSNILSKVAAARDGAEAAQAGWAGGAQAP